MSFAPEKAEEEDCPDLLPDICQGIRPMKQHLFFNKMTVS